MNNRESDYTQHIDGYQDDKMREYQDKPKYGMAPINWITREQAEELYPKNETEFSILITEVEDEPNSQEAS